MFDGLTEDGTVVAIVSSVLFGIALLVVLRALLEVFFNNDR